MIVFEIPLKLAHYSNKSTQYIFELFKYNGPNSLLRTLKEKDLIYSFDCYVAQQFLMNAILAFEFRLTKNGYLNMNKVIQQFFNFINQMTKNDLERDLYESLKQQSEIQFKFLSKNKEMADMLTSFQNYPLADLLYHEYSYKKFVPLQILEFFQFMDKDKA